MKGNCRFLRTKAGKSYFASVGLEVLPDGNGVTVEDALPQKVDADAGEVNRHTAARWVSAAQAGIHDAVDHARGLGLLAAGCRIQLTKLIGSFVDTREDVVHCAAALAFWQAIGGPEPGPTVAFESEAWKVLFPASVGNPPSGTSS